VHRSLSAVPHPDRSYQHTSLHIKMAATEVSSKSQESLARPVCLTSLSPRRRLNSSTSTLSRMSRSTTSLSWYAPRPHPRRAAQRRWRSEADRTARQGALSSNYWQKRGYIWRSTPMQREWFWRIHGSGSVCVCEESGPAVSDDRHPQRSAVATRCSWPSPSSRPPSGLHRREADLRGLPPSLRGPLGQASLQEGPVPDCRAHDQLPHDAR